MNSSTLERLYNPEILAGQIRQRKSGQVAMVITQGDGTFNAVDLMLGELVWADWIASDRLEIIRERYPMVNKEPRELRWTY